MLRLMTIRSLGMIAAAALMTACGGSGNDHGEEPISILPVTKVDGRYHQAKQAAASDLKRVSAPAATAARTLVLPALDGAALQLKTLGAAGALQVAEAQAVPQAQTPAQFAEWLTWVDQPDGSSTAVLEIRATDAFGLRLGVVVHALPVDAWLRVRHADDQGLAVEASAADIHTLIARNAEAGDTTDAGRTWWSPDLGGDSVVLEIHLPAGVAPTAVQLALPLVSHVFVNPAELDALVGDAASEEPDISAKNEQIPTADGCNLDVTCYTAGLQERDAVARMLFVINGEGYACTGTLLNDAIQSDLPYFLTANHCISNQTVASTLQTDWFFRSSACNAPTLDSRRTARTGGARLLFTSNATQGHDTTLLLLNDAPPPGTFLAGWDANQNNEPQFVFGVHHPQGALAKISGGNVVNYANCDGSTCGGASTGRFYQVVWDDGTTEGGSSGSAIFSGTGHVLGVLYGGSASCSRPDAPDFYGRLDMAFSNGIRDFLAASRNPF